MSSLWTRWTDLFEDEDDPAEPRYDPVHLAVVRVACQVAIGALYWLLWTLFVYEGGIAAGPRLANVIALGVSALAVAALGTADRREEARHRRE